MSLSLLHCITYMLADGDGYGHFLWVAIECAPDGDTVDIIKSVVLFCPMREGGCRYRWRLAPSTAGRRGAGLGEEGNDERASRTPFVFHG